MKEQVKHVVNYLKAFDCRTITVLATDFAIFSG